MKLKEIIGVIVGWYLVFAFVEFNFYLFEWAKHARLNMVFMVIVTTFIMYVIKVYEEEKKKKKKNN